jgi:hypothetical protein
MALLLGATLLTVVGVSNAGAGDPFPSSVNAPKSFNGAWPKGPYQAVPLTEHQSVTDGRCYWGIGFTFKTSPNAEYYLVYWKDGGGLSGTQAGQPSPLTSTVRFDITGGGGPAPCGPPDVSLGGRFTYLTAYVYTQLAPGAPKSTAHSITGIITYDYASGDSFAHGNSGPTQTTPARETMVDVLASTKSSCSTTLLESVRTDDTGTYTTFVPPKQKYVCVKVLAVTPYSEILPYPGTDVAAASNGAQLSDKAYASKALGPIKLAKSGPTTFSWQPKGADDKFDQALDIDNAVVTGANWVSAYGATPRFVNVLYPYPSSTEITNFNPKKTVGEINEDDAFDWGVLLHEYGHFVATFLGIDNTTPVKTNDHLLSTNLTNTETNKAQGLAISWNEGFADFFSQMVELAMGTASLGLTDVGATPPIYVDYTPTGVVSYELDVPGNTPPHPSLGEDNEASVARVLWSMFSQPTYSGLDGSTAFIHVLVNALTSNSVRNLSGAVNALLAAAHATPFVPGEGVSATNVEVPAGTSEATAALTYGPILSSQHVAPIITGSGVSPSGKSLALSWSAGQPTGAKDKLNTFLVQYFNDNGTTLLAEQVVVAGTGKTQDGSDVFQTTEAIPSSWKKTTVYVAVVGWNSPSATPDQIFEQLQSLRTGTDPLTGPYLSAPVSLKIP